MVANVMHLHTSHVQIAQDIFLICWKAPIQAILSVKISQHFAH